MRIIQSYVLYAILLIFLLGWCSSFQSPSHNNEIQERWERAMVKHDMDSLFFYQNALQKAYKGVNDKSSLQAYNRRFLMLVFNNKEYSANKKEQWLQQYPTTKTWNYALKIQWHSQYGERDSAYFYQYLLEKFPQQQALVYAYGQLAIEFGLNLHNYRQASNYLQLAEKSTKTASDSQLLYPVQMRVYPVLGQLEQGIKGGLALVNIYQQQARIDSVALGAVFGRLGFLYKQQKAYQEAIFYTRKAMDYLPNQEKYKKELGELCYQLAAVYSEVGDKPLETILYAKRALTEWSTKKENFTQNSCIDVYQLLAKGFLSVEQLDSSQVYLDKAQALGKKTRYQLVGTYAIRADLKAHLGEVSAVQQALRQALDVTLKEEGKKGKNTAVCWFVLGQHYQQQKQWKAAQEAFLNALWALSWQAQKGAFPLRSSLIDRGMALKVGNAQGQVLLALQEQSKYAISKEILQQQLDYNVALLQEVQLAQPWNTAFEGEEKILHQQLIEWQWRRFKKTKDIALLERALGYAEANRQAVMRKSLQQYWKQNPQVPLLQLQQELQAEQNQKEWCQKQIWEAHIQKDSSQLDWYRQQLAANNANWMLAYQQLKQQYPHYYQWYYHTEPFYLDSLQAKLNDGDVFLEYFEQGNFVFQFVITKDTLVGRPIFWEDYHTTMRKYNKHFTSQKMRQYLGSGSFQDFCRTGHSLYYRLVHHELFKSANRLIIVPDGLLQQLPFETLLTELPLDSIHKTDFSKLSYLLKHKQIHYHYNARLWLESWGGKAAPNNELLAIAATYQHEEGNEVYPKWRQQLPKQPYVTTLLDSLSKAYAGDFYTNRYASEYYYKKYATNYGLLYLGFYAHKGNADEDVPSLILAEDGYEKEDNRVSFFEIQAQHIAADLVLLENTYKTNVEDNLVLGSSFLYAGSKNVVFPLWQQDSTGIELVRFYYQGLQEGLENDEALRQAKLRYLNEAGATAGHPSHWAGYILIGNQSTIKVATPVTYIWWFVFPIAFISFLGWWSLRALRQRR